LAKGVLNVLLFVVAPKNPFETDQQYLCQQQEAAKSPEAAQRFLLGRLPPGVSPQQPSAFHRLIDFTFRSLSKPSLESLVTHAFVTNLVHPSWLEKLLSSRGLFVEEGMSPGPFQVHLRRLKLVDEPGDWDDGPGKGVGVQVTSRYEVGETVTHYLARPKHGRAIREKPPSRHCLTIANGLRYARTPLDKGRGLLFYANQKAMGPFINGATRGYNCVPDRYP
jgi:hypothetical protein